MINNVILGRHAPVKIWTEDVDVNSIEQLMNTASLPFIHKHVAAMPDVHLGLGATIGSVVATKAALIPAAVGVDIGCGMAAMKTELTAEDLPDSLAALRSAIEARIPVGFSRHDKASDGGIVATRDYIKLAAQIELPVTLRGQKQHDAVSRQMGTLGGGNHFVEVCLDEDRAVWIMLHSGSRGIGNQIGRHFIELAKKDMRIHHINLANTDLAYLSEGTKHFDDYWNVLEWCQRYARANRDEMLRLVVRAFRDVCLEPGETKELINCHHNYATIEHHYGKNVYVTRKGAIRARDGDPGIIPGSMGARSFIVRGKGNPESFNSCSHGAGRKMSRKKARAQFTSVDLANQTVGVECRKDADVVDEIPAAYKDIDTVMANQEDLVEIVHTLKQVVCVKG